MREIAASHLPIAANDLVFFCKIDCRDHKKNMLLNLPQEVLHKITKYLSIHAIHQLAQTCYELHYQINCEQLWKKRLANCAITKNKCQDFVRTVWNEKQICKTTWKRTNHFIVAKILPTLHIRCQIVWHKDNIIFIQYAKNCSNMHYMDTYYLTFSEHENQSNIRIKTIEIEFVNYDTKVILAYMADKN